MELSLFVCLSVHYYIMKFVVVLNEAELRVMFLVLSFECSKCLR